MELLLIILLVLYMGFKDFLAYKEREKLEMKLMSKSLGDYVTAEEKPDNTKQEEDPYIPIEEASVKQILESKDVI